LSTESHLLLETKSRVENLKHVLDKVPFLYGTPLPTTVIVNPEHLSLGSSPRPCAGEASPPSLGPTNLGASFHPDTRKAEGHSLYYVTHLLILFWKPLKGIVFISIF
jgi:hypothetical protein